MTGDLHMKRLNEVQHILGNHLQEVSVDWLHQGGAGVSFAERNIRRARGYLIVIIMLGGNDIANGMSPEQLADRMNQVANDILDEGPHCVIIPSLWPRQNKIFNNHRSYADRMEERYFMDPVITFWRWDVRQTWSTYDGVHLERRGYERAVRTIVAMIVWAINHNQ